MERFIKILTFTVLSVIVVGIDVVVVMKVTDVNIDGVYIWTICSVFIAASLTLLYLSSDIILDR